MASTDTPFVWRSQRIQAAHLRAAIELIELAVRPSTISTHLPMPINEVKRIARRHPAPSRHGTEAHVASFQRKVKRFAQLATQSVRCDDQLPLRERLVIRVLAEDLDVVTLGAAILSHVADSDLAARLPWRDGITPGPFTEFVLNTCWLKLTKEAVPAPRTIRSLHALAFEQCNWLLRGERRKDKTEHPFGFAH